MSSMPRPFQSYEPPTECQSAFARRSAADGGRLLGETAAVDDGRVSAHLLNESSEIRGRFGDQD